jgi:hypothetical protein
MPQVIDRHQVSYVPSLALGVVGVALGAALLHDAIDRRILTPASIFDSPLAVVGALLGVAMAVILVCDSIASRGKRSR